jgi:hypothetical protein
LFQYLRDNIYPVISSDSILDISLVTLKTILQQDELNVSELDLFLTCARWAILKKRPREALGSTLSLIRFRVFSVQNFARYVVPSQLLTDSEHTAIFCYLATRVGSMPLGFSNETRLRDIEGPVETISLAWTSGKHFSPEEIATSPPLCFTVNAQAYIFGVKLYATREHKSLKAIKYKECLELQLRNDEGVAVASASFYGLVEKRKHFTVTFESPCTIFRNETYSLYLNFKQFQEGCKFVRADCREQTHRIYSGLEITVQELEWNSIWGFIVAKVVSLVS